MFLYCPWLFPHHDREEKLKHRPYAPPSLKWSLCGLYQKRKSSLPDDVQDTVTLTEILTSYLIQLSAPWESLELNQLRPNAEFHSQDKDEVKRLPFCPRKKKSLQLIKSCDDSWIKESKALIFHRLQLSHLKEKHSAKCRCFHPPRKHTARL